MTVHGVAGTYLIQPNWLTLNDCVHRQSVMMGVAGKSVCSFVFLSFAIIDMIPETEQFCERLLLPHRGESLHFKMDQAFLICSDHKFMMLQVSTSLLHCHENCQALFFVGGEALILPAQGFAHVSNRVTILL
jgi:hypothetical protein